MESSVAPERAQDAATIAEAFRITARRQAGEVAIKSRAGDVAWTWSELQERVDALAGGLRGLGVTRGETVAIMLVNRPEFHLADLAVVTAGGTPFSIYQTYTPDQIAYVVSDSGAKVIITEQAFLPQVVAAREQLPGVEHVLLVDPPVDGAPAGTTPLAEIERSGAGFDAEAAVAELGPDDILTLIYTSGTTGPPKGVELTHRNLLSAVRGIEEIVQFPPGSRVVSWLPAAHIAERAAHHYLPIVYGMEVTSCEDPRAVIAVLPQVRPQWFFAVPRIWEKLKSGLEAAVAGMPDEDRARVQGALEAAKEQVRLEQAGDAVPAELAERAAAGAETFAGWRAMLGLDQVITINVGAAPTPVEVLEFFHAIGLPLCELWGMSETCGAGSVNPPGAVRIGTVGPPAPGVEIRLADDGEVLVRGEIVMLGYRNKPEQTAETIDADGWLHTGDIGQFDEAGYLKIVDRKKEIIINAAGKNMSPANIEAHVKSASPLIGQACCIGDRRPYNTSLIVLDPDFAAAFAAQHGIEDSSLAALARHPEVVAEVQRGVDAANEHLARVEQIKKFTIIEGDWLPGGDELTPTMKLKRKPIAEKYEEEIEALYAS
jgi:long-subunit acyl-CoA synthetase (AMP-forming)